jgi:CRP-like cAMP-binding protein
MHPSGIPIDIDKMTDTPLFRGLERHSVESIARGAWTVEYRRAARIIGRGEYLDGLFTVFDGRLKLYMLSCNGDERVLRVLGPGDTFGEAIMFNAIPSPVFVDALSPVSLGFFPRETITEALASDPKFTASMLRSMSGIMRMLLQDLETCCLQNAMQRTVNYLLREAEGGPPPHVEVRLPAAKAVVASMLNISAETFSRELHRLQDDGLIEINRRIIYLRDRTGLLTVSVGSSAPPAQRN